MKEDTLLKQGLEEYRRGGHEAASAWFEGLTDEDRRTVVEQITASWNFLAEFLEVVEKRLSLFLAAWSVATAQTGRAFDELSEQIATENITLLIAEDDDDVDH